MCFRRSAEASVLPDVAHPRNAATDATVVRNVRVFDGTSVLEARAGTSDGGPNAAWKRGLESQHSVPPATG